MKQATKISVSVHPDLLAALTNRAKRLYDGNISAVIAEMGEDVKRLDAMDRYIEKYKLAPLTESTRARIEAELAGPAAAPAVAKRTRS